MTKKIYISIVTVLLSAFVANAQSYPFDLPENMTAAIDITTSSQEQFNNLLLGTNIHDLAHSDGQELVRDFDPITVRFPHGLFSNWYDWEQDKARVYGTDSFTYTKPDGTNRTVEISYLSAIKTMDANNLYVGIDELNALNNEKKTATGKGYDMCWTFNMSADGTDFNNGSPVSVARYQDLISRGFEVKAIEMGNENFYAGQRSSIIPNPSDYIARAKSMYTALKALDPNLKLSINLERKSNPANTGWNTEMTQTTDYFDAVTVHTYVGHDPDDPANGDEAYSVALTAREVLRKTIDNYSKVVAPDKPIWLTEWGVRSGGPNAVSALGMADCYIFMSENQDTYERANWFSVNGKLNSHLVWHTVNGKLVIKEPLEKTSYGSTFEIVRSVYENSTLLGSEMNVPTLDGIVNAVNARAVTKDGQTIILVVNLSDQEVPFSINIDGMRFYGEFEHKAMAFSSMSDEITLPYNTDPLELIKEGRGGIYLPKYSINTIVLNDEEVLSLDFATLRNNDEIDKGTNLTVDATVGDEFKEVSLYVNDTLLSTKTAAPYSWSSFPQLTNMMEASYELKLVAKTQADEIVERSIIITTPEQWAYSSGFKPHVIPGKIEAEAYDYGGENTAHYDRSEQSASYSYRGEDKVDLSSNVEWLKYIQGDEWLEYTVKVERSGSYDLAVRHQTRRSPEFEAMSFSFQESSEALFSQLVCTYTGSDSTAIDTFSTAYLESGRHILRLDILGYGYDLDYFEFILTSNPIDYYNVGTLANPANPESYDKGNAIQNLLEPLDSLGFDFAGWFTNPECTDTIPVPAVAASDDGLKVFYAKWSPLTLSGSAFVYGDIIEGNTLYADTTMIENNSGLLLFQWQQSTGGEFVNIPGATNSSYTLLNTDVGSKLRIAIRSSLQFGSVISNVTNTILDVSDTTYTISYEPNGGEDGSITSEIVGIGGYPTFIAQPFREGYSVAAWTNVEGDTLNAQSVISSDTTLYARWEVKTRYKVSFNMGDGSVDIMTDGYPAFVPYLPPEPLQADSIFDKWLTSYGEGFDTSYLVFQDLEVFPTWQVKRFPLNVHSPNGTIIYEPQQSTYEIHTEVTLTARPTSNYEFLNWTGDYQSADSIITVVMDSTINLTANYKALPYHALDVYSAHGEVSKFPNSSRYISGFTVELTATPASGYEFVNWSGDYVGTENPLYLTLTEDMELFANFRLLTSIQESESVNIVYVFPNPNDGIFTIQLDENISATYKLYNIYGEEIQSGRVDSQQKIKVKENRPGVYMLEVSSKLERKVLRVIIK